MEKAHTKKKKKIILIICLFISIMFTIFGLFLAINFNINDLDIEQLTSINNGIKVYSSQGNESSLYNTSRSIIEIEDLPEHVKNAFIDTEDKRFYNHNGYDLKRIIKASFINLTSRSKSQGASTISQQLVKNTLLSNEKTYNRKFKEIILAIKMEKEFTKDEILVMYLNTIYFGSNAYGIENASQLYFDKSVKDLTINEACCLAGIIRSPRHYSPISNYENSIQRRNLIAKLMYENNNITEDEYNEVLSSEIEINTKHMPNHSYEQEAIYQACNLLNITERELINRNYIIHTYKDERIQENVIESNSAVLNSSKTYTDSNLDSISIVVSNDGKVLSYYVNSKYNLHNIKCQPASILKPIAVYLPCISHNILTPSTKILDESINYNGFSPRNSDTEFHGYVSTRYALAKSLNIPAVKALDYLGLDKCNDFLDQIGIILPKKDYNLSLALGSTSYGVELLDLVSAYTTIANMGKQNNISFIEKIVDNNGNIIYSNQELNQIIVDSGSCFLLTDILKDTATYGTAKRLSSLNIPIASKTGTAYNGNTNTDLYNISYSSEHTILSWISNVKTGKLPDSMYSSIEPTEINKRILSDLYKDNKPKDFKQPEDISVYPYDLVEYEENHKIISPTTQIERYIAYDYFKTNLPPESIDYINELSFNITLDKTGATILFDAKRNNNYKLYKTTNDGTVLVTEIKEKSDKIVILDNNIFKEEKIDYFITKNNDINSEKISIRPKDFLINLLNNQIIDSKRKWYV